MMSFTHPPPPFTKGPLASLLCVTSSSYPSSPDCGVCVCGTDYEDLSPHWERGRIFVSEEVCPPCALKSSFYHKVPAPEISFSQLSNKVPTGENSICLSICLNFRSSLLPLSRKEGPSGSDSICRPPKYLSFNFNTKFFFLFREILFSGQVTTSRCPG